jgi:cytochrome P450
MLSQHDSNGAGISKAVATELSILLYMILDAGNAWTSMALNLLALDHSALKQVEDELSHLTVLHGNDELFTPRVMGQMRYLDALIWESIRLCPPFLGGMKVLSETVELPDDGVQIPKNANVIFCNPTEGNFDLSEAWGKRPQELTFLYPCREV